MHVLQSFFFGPLGGVGGLAGKFVGSSSLAPPNVMLDPPITASEASQLYIRQNKYWFWEQQTEVLWGGGGEGAHGLS